MKSEKTLAQGKNTNSQNELAIYVHVPFCRARCSYCDFNTYAGLEDLIPAYVDALCQEIQALAGGHCRTVYFGGGTPSLLDTASFKVILDGLCAHLGLTDSKEVTLEANPGTVSQDKLERLRSMGINRLSLGVQSAHDDELDLLGRIHTWAEALQAVSAARAAGFDNLNLDLIYGLPGQSLDRWQRTLRAVLALKPEHLSLYALTLEPGTVLERQVAAGEQQGANQDMAAEMVEWAERALAEAGYFHYELSNWAWGKDRIQKLKSQMWWPTPSTAHHSLTTKDFSPFVCRHNLVYWRNEPYLGLGAGAASWYGGQRWTQIHHPAEYIARMQAGETVRTEIEVIDRRLEMGEMMMMGLRLAEGVSDARFQNCFNQSMEAVFGGPLAALQDVGLVEWDGQVARLTARGRLLGNQVFGQFLPDL